MDIISDEVMIHDTQSAQVSQKQLGRTSWKIIVFTRSIPLNSCCVLYKCHQGMLDAANRLFSSMLLRNRGKYLCKDQVKDCEKTQNF